MMLLDDAINPTGSMSVLKVNDVMNLLMPLYILSVRNTAALYSVKV